jgi:hypothetical protein
VHTVYLSPSSGRTISISIGADPATKGERHALIVFDHSVSMEHKGDGPASRERAVHEAGKLIDSLGPEDPVNILLMESSPTTCFVDFSKDHARPNDCGRLNRAPART